MRTEVVLKKIFVFAGLLFSAAVLLPLIVSGRNSETAENSATQTPEKKVDEPRSARHIGEKIIYDVRLGALYLGKATFWHRPSVALQGKSMNLMTFEARLARFRDLEKIYSDPATNLPLRVERDVGTWPLPEKITEEYDQSAYVVTIKKLKGGREHTFVSKKSGPINHAILLPYYVRDLPGLKVGWSIKVVLPSQAFEITLVAKENVTVPAGTFKAFRFKSTPEKFEIWVSADERRIPLKIKGMGGLGYNFVMRKFSKE